ncbi:MAG: hypothetical protein OEY09_00930 [Gammaproteobacteria bacterium]|nr:hypothetical protein [Gammaproteobacteria bacterium]
MTINCITTKRKISILRITALVFLLQMVSPAVQAVLANNVEGYTDTVCTMNGQKAAFIILRNSQEQSSPTYFQCSACIIQANLTGLPKTISLQADTRYFLDSVGQVEAIYPAPNIIFYPHFLSRAPPV